MKTERMEVPGYQTKRKVVRFFESQDGQKYGWNVGATKVGREIGFIIYGPGWGMTDAMYLVDPKEIARAIRRVKATGDKTVLSARGVYGYWNVDDRREVSVRAFGPDRIEFTAPCGQRFRLTFKEARRLLREIG